jgi:hypothetical protein
MSEKGWAILELANGAFWVIAIAVAAWWVGRDERRRDTP